MSDVPELKQNVTVIFPLCFVSKKYIQYSYKNVILSFSPKNSPWFLSKRTLSVKSSPSPLPLLKCYMNIFSFLCVYVLTCGFFPANRCFETTWCPKVRGKNRSNWVLIRTHVILWAVSCPHNIEFCLARTFGFPDTFVFPFIAICFKVYPFSCFEFSVQEWGVPTQNRLDLELEWKVHLL